MNSRFSISVHILTLLATIDDELVSSELLASSINIHPVLVRKELSNLRNHGLVESKEGKTGGSWLAKPAGQIRMSDIYRAVQQNSLLGKSKNQPNPRCPVGQQINQHLDNLFNEAEESLIKGLGKTTLADFCKQFSL